MTSSALLRGVVTGFVVVQSVAAAAAPAAQDGRTLREAVALAGFADSLAAPGGRDWDRPLTSSDFGSDKDSFVAACYFEDELKSDQTLGPLHLYRFSRAVRAWTHRPMPEASGSIMSVEVARRTILVQTHWTPSAGSILVIDSTLKPLATLKGFNGIVLPNGEVLYTGNMIHFAPTHPERLLLFDRKSRRTTEMFPGPRESKLAVGVRRAIRDAAARLPPDAIAQIKQGPYGLPDDFDRTVMAIAVSTDGQKIAFVVSYSNLTMTHYTHALVDGEDVPKTGVGQGTELETLATCRRSSTAAWACEEEPLESAARRLGIPLDAKPAPHRLDSLDFVTRTAVRRR